MINPNDSLDLLARDRVSSVFLPEKRYTMFHPALSESHFSLLPLRLNYALSFLVNLDPEGKFLGLDLQLTLVKGDILDYEITPSIIDNVQSLTYAQADKKLATSTDAESLEVNEHKVRALKQLHAIAMARRSWRERHDATFVEFPSPEISVKGDGEYIDVSRIDAGESPSRLMVAEYMILVGEICAKFAIKHEIPIPFRCQQPQSLLGMQ
jgi:exoribonuclease-2